MTIEKKLNDLRANRVKARARATEQRIMRAVNAAKVPQRTLLEKILCNPSKQPWRSFGPKVLLVCAIVAPACVYVFDRFNIGIDPQNEQCLPWRVFLIDKYDKQPVRGETFAFMSPHMERYGRGIKFVDGVGGDLVAVDGEHTSVNGKVVGNGLMFAGKLGFTPQQLTRTGQVPEGNVWLMGRTDNSFDSRYWNSISETAIIGRAYPIW